MRWIPWAILGIAAAAMLAYGPIPQIPDYHRFADARAGFGMANAWNVLSNLPFALVGAAGLRALAGARPSAGRLAYQAFFASLVLTALGSGYYHLAPGNDRLFYDRLPIALACAALLAAVLEDTHRSIPRWTLAALVVAAVASVLWWSATDARGAGDLRPYLLLQGAPLVLIPVWQALHGTPRGERIVFGIAIALYVVAKVAEVNDRAIFDALGFVSGHTLKHLLAAAGAAMIALALARRGAARPGYHSP
jgi:hypothetical protein